MKGFSKSGNYDLAPFVIALCAFCLLFPWFLWRMSNYVRFGALPALYMLAIIPNMSLRRQSKALFALFFALLLFVCIIQGYNILYSLSILSLSIVPFIKENVFEKAMHYFEIILAIFLGGGMLFWILKLIGIPLPNHYLAPLNEEFVAGYTVYPPFLVVRNGIFDFFRFFGPFDEPGVVGTVSAFVMYVERYNLKKWYILVIFIAAILSFSFMFFAASLLYVAFSFIKKPSWAILSILLVVSFYAITKDIPQFQYAIYDRFEWNADMGKFEGDTRFGESQQAYLENIRGTSDYYFGDHGKSQGDFVGARSYIDAIISYGFIFCFLYVFWFVVYARDRKLSWYHTLIFLSVLLLNLYQRPNFISFSYIFLYTALIINWRPEKLPINNVKRIK